MAVRQIRTCDIDAKHEDADAVVFGGLGQFFTADLCAADATKLEKALEPFVVVASAISARDVGKQANGQDFEPAVVRAWAIRNGHTINEKGRVAADIVAAWRKAQQP